MMRRFGAAAFAAAVMLLHPVYAQQPTAAANNTAANSTATKAPVAAVATKRPELIPTADLALTPLVSGPKLSPDGKMLLAMLGTSDKATLGLIILATGEKRAFPMSRGYEVVRYRWAGNGKVLISLGKTEFFHGEEIYVTRMIAYDVAKRTTEFVGKRSQGIEGDDVLYVDPDGKWLLLSIQETIYDYPSVYRVDLETGKMKRVVTPQSGIWEWYADDKGVVRAGVSYKEKKWSLYYRKSEDQSFKRAGSAGYEDIKAGLGLMRFALDSDEGYILSSEQTGRYALYRFNYATLTFGERVFESHTNDISDFDMTADGSSLLAAYYTDVRDRVEWFDPLMKEVQAALDKAIAPKEAWIVSYSRDKGQMLVLVTSPDEPGVYYYFEPAAGVMQRLANKNEKLRGRLLARTKPVSYTARDGLTINGYLTLPPGREPKGLPLIILPHGGPYGVRDNGAYDPEVQLLANRGYAVLQPNYRGSGSYGYKFEEKGNGQWGRAMQDDLDDGMDWLVKQGIADPKRVCIVGSSYGGYAALWGATRNPERYRCAASFAGVSDVARQLRYSRDFFYSRKSASKWQDRVRGEESFDINTISPLHQVAKLSVPVLLTHGEDDQRVPVKQSTLYAEALKKAGKTHEIYVYPEEGHGLTDPENLKDYFDRLEAFLKKHNPAD